MPDPGITRPDLCPVRAAAGLAEPAETARGGLTADGHPPADDDPPVPLVSGIDRATRFSPRQPCSPWDFGFTAADTAQI